MSAFRIASPSSVATCLALAATLACGDNDAYDGAIDALEEGDVLAAEQLLVEQIESGDATREEYALAGLTGLMTLSETCSPARQTARSFGADVNLPADFFGPSGFFAVAVRDSREAASVRLGDRYDDDAYEEDFDSIQEAVDQIVSLLPCVDRIADRFERALEPGVQLNIVMPRGPFRFDRDITLDTAELYLILASVQTSAAMIQFVDGFNWDLPWVDDAYSVSAPDLGEVEADLQQDVDDFNEKFFRVRAGGASSLSSARDRLLQGFDSLLYGLEPNNAEPVDTSPFFLNTELSPRAAEIMVDIIQALQAALNGPVQVPLTSEAVSFDLSDIFDGNLPSSSYDALVLEIYSVGDGSFDVVADFEAGWFAERANQLFSKVVVDEPGGFGRTAEVTLFDEFDNEDCEAFSLSLDALSNIRVLIDANLDDAFTDSAATSFDCNL